MLTHTQTGFISTFSSLAWGKVDWPVHELVFSRHQVLKNEFYVLFRPVWITKSHRSQFHWTPVHKTWTRTGRQSNIPVIKYFPATSAVLEEFVVHKHQNQPASRDQDCRDPLWRCKECCYIRMWLCLWGSGRNKVSRISLGRIFCIFKARVILGTK